MALYPSRSDYVTAMKNPNVSFRSNELKGGKIFQKGSRVIQYSGGYSIVFPFNKSNTKKVAVRCWIADIGDGRRRSQAISSFLDKINCQYFVKFKYIDKALLINGILHPIVIMDWVDGQTLKNYINQNIHNPGAIFELAEKFKEMVLHFHKLNIAHGDLQHGNIMITNMGQLVVIDYDSMFIEALDGMDDTIKGLAGYQHPSRSANKQINPKLDFFAELIIYLSLLTYADKPELWNDYFDTEDLLFSKEDYLNPEKSKLIADLVKSPNKKIADLVVKLKIELGKRSITELIPLDELLVDKLERTKDDISKKWDNQPNVTKANNHSNPDSSTIINKF